MSATPHARRAQKSIRKDDISEGAVLRDKVYGETVKVVGVYVGQVYLRYPHHAAKTMYEHECGTACLGREELEDHAADCDEGNPEWWETSDPERMTEMIESGDCPYEVIERPNLHVESVSYDWPLDGHRFTIVEG